MTLSPSTLAVIRCLAKMVYEDHIREVQGSRDSRGGIPNGERPSMTHIPVRSIANAEHR
jgi:hypothetical protein